MLEAYNIAQKYDLSLKGYITLLAQTILMMLREGVFVCTTRKTYPLGLSALLTSINVYYVKWESEKLLCENQKSYIGVIYHSPSQSCNDFLLNLEKLINQIKQLKPSITIIFGDFNARYSDWWAHDITSTEDTQSIVKPLSIIFKNCIDNGIFPGIWKKPNILPVHKKGNKQIINNHWPVSLLPICGEFFEKLQFFIIYFLMIIIFSVLISQDSHHQIPANINFFQ